MLASNMRSGVIAAAIVVGAGSLVVLVTGAGGDNLRWVVAVGFALSWLALFAALLAGRPDPRTRLTAEHLAEDRMAEVRFAVLQKEAAALKAAHEKLVAESHAFAASVPPDLREAAARFADVEAARDAAVGEVERLSEQLRRQDAAVKETAEEAVRLEAARAEVERSRAEVERARAEAERVSAEVEAFRAEAADRVETAEAERTSSVAAQQRLASDLVSASSRADAALGDVARLTAERRGMEVEIERLRAAAEYAALRTERLEEAVRTHAAETAALRARAAEPVADTAATARHAQEVATLTRRAEEAERAVKVALKELGADPDALTPDESGVHSAVGPLTLYAFGESTPGWHPPEDGDTLAAALVHLRRQADERLRQLQTAQAALDRVTRAE